MGPKYPPQLQPKKSPHIRSSTDNQQYFCSDNVTRVPCDINLYTLGPDDEAPLTFSCSGKKGAFLYLPLLSERHDTVARGDFGEWILENIDTCFKVAEDLGYGVERMEDIILVTGCHLAKSWIGAAFSDSRGGSDISFGVRASRNSGVHFDERNVNGRGLKPGPSGENLPQNQCIFVRGFRVTRILSIWPRLRGAGPAADFGEREPESDRRLELISIPADTDYEDPLDILSMHIAEQAPDCDMILLHDDDLQFIDDAPDDSESIRDTQCYAPAIRQVQCNLPDDQTGSGPEAAIHTVATFSEDVFKKQHEDRHNLEYSRSTVIMSGPANVTSLPKSPEIPGPVSSGLHRSVPPVSQVDEFMSLPTPTALWQERFTDSVGPPSDNLPKCPPHVAPRTCIRTPTASFARPTGQLTSLTDLVPLSPYSPASRRILYPKLPSIPGRRVRGEPEDSSNKIPRRFELSGGNARVRQTIRHLYYLWALASLRESILLDLRLRSLVAEREPHGSSGFSSETSRTGRLLSKRNNDGNKPFCRSFLDRYTEAEPGPYSSGRCFSRIDPPLPHRRINDRSDTNYRCRSSSRMELIPPSDSFQAVFPFLTSSFSNQTSDFPPRPSYSRIRDVMRNVSALLLPSGVADSPLPLGFSVGTAQSTLVPQRRWTKPFEGEGFLHADGTMLQPIFFDNSNSVAGFWLPDILLHDGSHEPYERDSEAPLRIRGGATTHVRINWPGYSSDRVVEITTRDLTNARSPITLARFMNCVRTSVDEIFNQYLSYVHSNIANAGRGFGPHHTTQCHVRVIGAVRIFADTWVPVIQLSRHLPSSPSQPYYEA